MKTLLIKITILITLTKQNFIIKNPYERSLENDDEIMSEEEVPQEAYPLKTDEEYHNLETEESIIYFSKYQRLLTVGSIINKFYNEIKNKIPKEEEDEEFDKEKEIIIFELGKIFIEIITQEYEELKEEFADFIENIDKIDMTLEGCLEFFGFDEYFNNLNLNIDQNNQQYLDLLNELNLIVHEFVGKIRDFVLTVKFFFKFSDPLFFFAVPFQNSFDSEEGMDILDKQEIGNNLIKLFTKFYRNSVKKLLFFKIGKRSAFGIRDSLLKQIKLFRFLDKPQIPGFQEGVLNYGFFFISFLILGLI